MFYEGIDEDLKDTGKGDNWLRIINPNMIIRREHLIHDKFLILRFGKKDIKIIEFFSQE